MPLKVTVITVCRNVESTIRDTLESVRSQDYPNIEHIIVDGNSTDGTLDVIRKHGAHVAKVISEPDAGLYDAMNKGWKLATGDLVGYLHGDDVFADSTCIRRIAEMAEASGADIMFGDVDIVEQDDMTKVIRYYRASDFSLKWIEQGDHPNYAGFYVRREIFTRFGGYDLQFPLCADYDFSARLYYVNHVSYAIVPYTLAKMRTGGLSNSGPRATLKMAREVFRAARKNNVPLTIWSMAQKYLRKASRLSALGARG